MEAKVKSGENSVMEADSSLGSESEIENEEDGADVVSIQSDTVLD